MSHHAPAAVNRSYRFEGPGVKTAMAISFALGAAGLALGGAFAAMSPESRPEFYFAYHTAFIFCLTLTLGGLFVTIIHHLCKWRAIVVLRRIAEAVMMNMSLMAVLFLPIAFWMPNVFKWAAYDQMKEQAAPNHGEHAALFMTPAYAQGSERGEAGENGPERVEKTHDLSQEAGAPAKSGEAQQHGREGAAKVGVPESHHPAHEEFNVHLLEKKSPYLNKTFFLWRAFAFFAIWIFIASYFYRASLRQDATGDPEISVRLRARAAPAVLVFALTGTFAFFDWTMGLDYEFFSTIWGLYHFGGIMIAIMSYMILLSIGIGKSEGMRGAVTVEHYHDLGKMCLTFIIFWSYIAFSQYMLIWYANLPEETEWFQARTMGAWRGAAATLLFGHFAIPFLLLLPRWLKRTVPLLAGMAIYLLCIHYVDLHWIIMPALRPDNAGVHIIDIALWLGMLGLFTGVTLMRLSRAPLAPVGDPYLEESLRFQNM